MAINSKAKGGQFEREIAKYLTMWLTGQDKEYYFWRSPGSGSVATISPINTGLHGDIIPLKPEAEILCSNFTIELKNGYPNATIDNHLKKNKNDIIEDFWKQVTENATHSNKRPLLIFKKKGFSMPWVGINDEVFNWYIEDLISLRNIRIKWDNELSDLILFEMKPFFKTITPEILSGEL